MIIVECKQSARPQGWSGTWRRPGSSDRPVDVNPCTTVFGLHTPFAWLSWKGAFNLESPSEMAEGGTQVSKSHVADDDLPDLSAERPCWRLVAELPAGAPNRSRPPTTVGPSPGEG